MDSDRKEQHRSYFMKHILLIPDDHTCGLRQRLPAAPSGVHTGGRAPTVTASMALLECHKPLLTNLSSSISSSVRLRCNSYAPETIASATVRRSTISPSPFWLPCCLRILTISIVLILSKVSTSTRRRTTRTLQAQFHILSVTTFNTSYLAKSSPICQNTRQHIAASAATAPIR